MHSNQGDEILEDTVRIVSLVIRSAASAGLVLSVAACGSSSPPDATKLFGEYARSTDVVGDEFGAGETTGDRLANFASRGNPQQVMTGVLAAYPCIAEECSPDLSVDNALVAFAGSTGKTYKRHIVVKRGDGQLELMKLYVARKPDGSSVLVGPEGKTFRGGLEDFRRHNDVLDSDDHIVAPRNITAVPGKGEIVATTGHTGRNWTWWLLAGMAAAALATGTLVFRARRTTSFD
ncbi:hypothetical protein [Actinomadura sp. 3N407]|uniref:hypothetical protein n=1 Tax=Actinomadura sp. 3N407 TaxID=3457423 RepID=UPI003FCE6699